MQALTTVQNNYAVTITGNSVLSDISSLYALAKCSGKLFTAFNCLWLGVLRWHNIFAADKPWFSQMTWGSFLHKGTTLLHGNGRSARKLWSLMSSNLCVTDLPMLPKLREASRTPNYFHISLQATRPASQTQSRLRCRPLEGRARLTHGREFVHTFKPLVLALLDAACANLTTNACSWCLSAIMERTSQALSTCARVKAMPSQRSKR